MCLYLVKVGNIFLENVFCYKNIWSEHYDRIVFHGHPYPTLFTYTFLFLFTGTSAKLETV